MLRLLLTASALCALLAAHLRTSRRKGSHREQSHGSWSANNPFESKRASRAKAVERGRKMAGARKASGKGTAKKAPAKYAESGVSSGLDYSDPKISAAVEDAIRSIEGVHGAPGFEAARRGPNRSQRMLVRAYPDGAYKPARGEYLSMGAGIYLDADQPHEAQMETAVHEIGHWIAERGLGNGLDDATQAGSALKNFKKAAKASPSMERWKKGAKNRFNFFQDQDKYFKKMPEVFARAYTQWVATRTDGPFKDAFREVVPEPGNPRNELARGFWPPEEFAPIADALESDFKRAGWL